MSETKTREAAAPPPLSVEAKVYPSKKDGNLLAYASVTLGGCFAINNIRIMDSQKGMFLAMPDRQDAKGEYRDVCFPTTAEMRQALTGAVMGEYQRVMELSAPVRFCNFSPNGECKKMADKGVQPLNDYTCRFRPSSLKCTDKSGLDGLQADK